MNNETRKALMEVIEAELDSYCPSPFNGAFAVSLMQIIDRLLTPRAVPEPDPGLDELLNSVPNMEISETGKEGYYVHYGENQWFDATAVVRVYKDDDRSPDAKYDVYTGTAPTRKAAIKAAVAAAKEVQDGTR